MFKTSSEAPIARLDQIYWKYFNEGPEWQGSRSFQLRDGDRLLAHCCGWPVRFLYAGREYTALHSLDWASTAPGAGLQLWREMWRLSDVFVGVNGSPYARGVIAKLPFRVAEEIHFYSRVIRPLAYFQSRKGRAPLPELLRLVRNSAFLLRRLSPIPRGWDSLHVEKFDASVEPVLPKESDALTPNKRTTDFLNFMLRCPVASLTGHLLRCNGTPRGYFLLSQVNREVRMADLWIDSTDVNEWTIAVSLLIRAASELPDAAQVICAGSNPLVRQAIENNQVRYFQKAPIFLKDPKKHLEKAPPLHWNLVDGDQAFL